MSNMSYCRFENTSGDFADCVDALREIEAGHDEKLSESELEAAKTLFAAALETVTNLAEEIGVDLADLDETGIAKALDAIQAKAGTEEAAAKAHR